MLIIQRMVFGKRNRQLPHAKRLGRPHSRTCALAHLVHRQALSFAQPHDQQPLRLQSARSMQQQRLSQRRLQFARRQHLRRSIGYRIRGRQQGQQGLCIFAHGDINSEHRQHRSLKSGSILKEELRIHTIS